nr:hypothetical protein [Phytohabitans suffuscus]
MTFSAAVSALISRESWETTPMRRRNLVACRLVSDSMRTPSTMTLPASGRSWAEASRSNVLLPEPDGPARATA